MWVFARPRGIDESGKIIVPAHDAHQVPGDRGRCAERAALSGSAG